MDVKKFINKQFRKFLDETLPKLEKQTYKRMDNIEKEYDRLKDAPIDKLKQEYNNRLTPPERKTAIERIMREKRG